VKLWIESIDDSHDGDGHEERGKESPRATAIEMTEAERVRPGPFLKEQGRDQEAAEDEEDVDADEAADERRSVWKANTARIAIALIPSSAGR
jgi:hypothetical protein